MHYSPILAPVVALVAWTLVVMFWMLITRGASSAGSGSRRHHSDGARGVDLEGKADAHAHGNHTITIT